jgi:hypothetical protein
MKIGGLVAAFVLAFAAQSASASVVLDFSGLDNVFFQDGPLNYYAGGTSIEGNGPGPNYGVTFSDNAFSCDACFGFAAPPPPGNFLIFSDPILPGGPPAVRRS